MYHRSGNFDSCFSANQVEMFSCSYLGQSGSSAYLFDGLNRTVYAVYSNGGNCLGGFGISRFVTIWPAGFTAIRDQIIGPATPETVDLIPLNVQVSPSDITTGQTFDSMQYAVHNYSTAAWSGTVELGVYLSTNDNISPADTLISTRQFTYSFAPKSTVVVTASDPLPTVPCDVQAGAYWVGIILEISDADEGNNDSDWIDADSIAVLAGNCCGDGDCSGEDCSTCPQDCGPCATCGDGDCNGNEDCSSCPQDCGECPDCNDDGDCDDGNACNGVETCIAGRCQPGAPITPCCGNGTVEPGEECDNCPEDVQCLPSFVCMGGVCQSSSSIGTCGSSLCATNLVVNGTFDQNADGWTLIDFHEANWQPIVGCNDRVGAFFVNHGGGVFPVETSQLISGLLPLRTYAVTGCYQRNSENWGDPNFRVLLDDETVFEAGGMVSDGWQSFEVSFVPSDSDVLLRFQTQIMGDDAYYIDNISMTLDNLVVNGDFAENAGGWTPINFHETGWQPIAGCDGEIGAFFVNGGGSDSFVETSQLITDLIPHQTYEVCGCYQRHSENWGAINFRVLLDDETVFEAGGMVSDGWLSFEVSFVPNDSDVLLRFQTQINGDDAYYIDNISVSLENLVANGDFAENADGWTLINFHEANWQPIVGCDGDIGAFFVNHGAGAFSVETSQLVDDLFPSQSYFLSGCYRRHSENWGNPNLRVLIDDEVVFEAGGTVADAWLPFALPFVPDDNDVLLRFQTQIVGDDAYYIDNVRICSTALTCPWDCDGSGDGSVNVTDLLALLAQYDPQAPGVCDGGESCDYDGNGCVDVTDLLELLAHYTTDPQGIGCP